MSDTEAAVAAQGLKVKALKDAKADVADIKAAVRMLPVTFHHAVTASDTVWYLASHLLKVGLQAVSAKCATCIGPTSVAAHLQRRSLHPLK
jgi:hypothetical protein